MENFETHGYNPFFRISSDEDIIELSKKIRDSNALTVSWTNSSQQKNDGINELVSPSDNYTESSSADNYEVETESYQEDSTYNQNSSAQPNNTDLAHSDPSFDQNVQPQQPQQAVTPTAYQVQPTGQMMSGPAQQTHGQIQNNVQAPIYNHNINNNTDKYRHKYIPIIYDDFQGCVTYVASVSVDNAARIEMKDYQKLTAVLKNNRNTNSKDIARLYIESAVDYHSIIKVSIIYINLNEDKNKKEIFIDKNDFYNFKIYERFIENGVNCFNTSISKKSLSKYMHMLISSKMQDGSELPDECGFARFENRPCFASFEFFKNNNLPSITDKHFTVESGESSIVNTILFNNIIKSHSEPRLFLLLNMIRVLGLISTSLNDAGYRFNRIVFIKGNAENLSKYLQVYDRDVTFQKVKSINVPPKKIVTDFIEEKDTVVMFNDSKNATAHQKANGVYALELLNEVIFDIQKNTEYNYPFVITVFSDRLGQQFECEKSLIIDADNKTMSTDVDERTILNNCYEIDKLIVKSICSDMNDFIRCTTERYTKYYERYNNVPVESRHSFTLLMIAYFIIADMFKNEIALIISESEMFEYLSDVFKKSQKSYNGGDVIKEFQIVLNKMILNDNIELVENSSMNNCYGSTGTKPVIFNDNKWLYFTNEAFEAVAEKVTIAGNSCALRKILNEEGYLKISENLKYKVTLYDSKYSGKINVTAVTMDVLSKQSKAKQLGGMFNFTPCIDDKRIERILLGYDEKGREVFWSVGHDELSNLHLVINGRSGTGKTTAANLIAKSLYDKGNNIAYVDFSGSNTPNKLIGHGYSKDFVEENMLYIKISDILYSTEKLNEVLDELDFERKIVIFSANKYSTEEVEEFLLRLYEQISSDEEYKIYLVIDEMHKLEYKKNYALYNIMETGRGNGISLISIFQGPHEMKPKQLSMLNQSEVKMIFKMSDKNDSQSIAESNYLKPTGKFVERISELPKRKCILTGNLENNIGELQNNCFIEIRIPDVNDDIT